MYAIICVIFHGNHKQEVDNPMTYRTFPMHPLLSGCLGVTIIHMTIPKILHQKWLWVHLGYTV